MTLINNQKIVENWISQDPKKPFFEKRTIRASRKNPEIVCKQDLGNRFYKFLLKLGKKRYPNQKFENLSEITLLRIKLLGKKLFTFQTWK